MNKKVAIQYVGLVRGFKFKNTRDLIYQKIIRALENQGYEVDIFWHTYDIEFDDIVYNLNKNEFNIKELVVDRDKEVQDYLENEYELLKKFEFPWTWEEAVTNPAERERDVGVDGQVSPHYHKYGWFKYQKSVEKCTRLRTKYEKKKNIKYDWVILTSPQMEPQNTMDDLRELENDFMYSPSYGFCGGYYVSFIMGSPEHINYLGDLYYNITNGYFNWPGKIDSEPLNKEYIDAKYTMKSILNIRFNRIRFNGLRIDH